MAFLRNLLATILGVFIATGIMFFISLLMISITASSLETTIFVKDNSVLVIDLTKPLEDYGGDFKLGEDSPYDYTDYTGVYHILKAIKHAKEDSKIKGITINNTKSINGGMAAVKAVRDALKDFKESGKFVYSYADNYTQKDYYLSSVADSVFVNPVGDIDFKGLSSEVLFFKDLQDKTGVKMEVIRHGEYKSAVEPFLQNQMSNANREQLTELLQSIWSTMVTDIASSRKLSAEQLNTIADSLNARTPTLALKNKIVDGIYYKDQYEGLLKKSVGFNSNDELNTISIYEYSESTFGSIISTTPEENKIAVIFAQGEIKYGEGNSKVIGQDIIVKALKEARGDKNVKGIVLRVNSPGGSALASDIIWREVILTQKAKPVYVSMGNYAASGGYYISCGAEKIVAQPNTITGSIGVFGILPNVQELANRWGIHSEQVGTNKNASGYSVFRELSNEKRKEIQQGIEQFYETFVNKVAEGRHMTFEQVDAIARGRVWSGTDALEKGLVDQLGGLEDTVTMLATDKNISNYTIVTYPEYESSVLDFILNKFASNNAKVTEKAIEDKLGTETYQLLKELEYVNQLKGIQARLPYELNIN